MSEWQLVGCMAGVLLCLECLVAGVMMGVRGYRVSLWRLAVALTLTWVPVILLLLLFGLFWFLLPVLFVARIIAVKVLCDVEWQEAYSMTRMLLYVEGALLIALIVYAFATGGGSFRITPFM